MSPVHSLSTLSQQASALSLFLAKVGHLWPQRALTETESGPDVINPEGNRDALKNSGSGPGRGTRIVKTEARGSRILTSVLGILCLGGGAGGIGEGSTAAVTHPGLRRMSR